MKKLIRIIIIVVVLVAALIAYSIYTKSKNKPEWRLDSTSRGTIREEVTASGSLSASSQVDVGTEVSGKVVKIYKDFNDNVKKGDILAKLDTQNLQSSLESAQATLNKTQLHVNDTKIDYDLQTELHRSDITTSYDLQKAQNTYNQALQDLSNARAAVERAKTNLQYAIITSPIDGVIISRSVDEGQTVAASLNAPTLFIIANDLKKMQINADIDEADISKIKIGQTVEFTVDAFADEQFEGAVKQVRLNPSTTNNVVTYTVVIDVSNPDLKLLPGMTANVTIIVLQKDNILRVPDTALRFKPSKELWKQFGLKWDTTLSSGFRNRNSSSNNRAPAVSNGQNSGNRQSSRRNNQTILPDSVKAKLAKMTPEQRKAYVSNMTSAGKKPDLSKMTPEQIQAYRKRSGQNGPGGNQNTAGQKIEGQFDYSTYEATADIKNKVKVWVLVNGKPTALEIITGLSDGTYSEVISGLKDGQEMITGVNYKNAKQAAAANKSAFQQGGGGFGPR